MFFVLALTACVMGFVLLRAPLSKPHALRVRQSASTTDVWSKKVRRDLRLVAVATFGTPYCLKANADLSVAIQTCNVPSPSRVSTDGIGWTSASTITLDFAVCPPYPAPSRHPPYSRHETDICPRGPFLSARDGSKCVGWSACIPLPAPALFLLVSRAFNLEPTQHQQQGATSSSASEEITLSVVERELVLTWDEQQVERCLRQEP